MVEKSIDISRNMSLLTISLGNKFGPFRELDGSNSKVGLDEKPRYSEDLENELRKEHDKEKPSSISITPSQPLLKMEEKVDIKPYQDDINVVQVESLVAIFRSVF
jgi:hypothetical protein